MNKKVFSVLAVMVIIMVMLLIVAPASAGGAIQISGLGLYLTLLKHVKTPPVGSGL